MTSPTKSSVDLIDYQLKLVLEVTRHGQRAPSDSQIFDLAANPDENFQVPLNLTMTGAENHHANGATIRKMIDERSPGFLSKDYLDSEIYI